MRGYVGDLPVNAHLPSAQGLLPLRFRMGPHVLVLASTISLFCAPSTSPWPP